MTSSIKARAATSGDIVDQKGLDVLAIGPLGLAVSSHEVNYRATLPPIAPIGASLRLATVFYIGRRHVFAAMPARRGLA